MSLTKGDTVTVVSSNLSRGYLIHRAATELSPPAEGWIPSYCLHLPGSSAKKPSAWAFKIRKQSLNKLARPDCKAEGGQVFVEHLNNVNITVGETCLFTCRVETGPGSEIVWKGPGGGLLLPGGRTKIELDDSGQASLSIARCQPADSGDYYCILANEEGSLSSSARLTVSFVPQPPGQPRVQDLKGSSAVVSWDRLETGGGRVFCLQQCRLATGHWQTVRDNITEGLSIVEGLVQGETYSFRVLSHSPDDSTTAVSEPSPPSPPLTVPLADLGPAVAGVPHSQDKAEVTELLDPAWRPDFELQYIELEEVGRGRVAVVRRCQEILTGREVAVKFVNRRKQSREQTRREYELLRKLSHPNIVSASGLFVSASSDAIVMDL